MHTKIMRTLIAAATVAVILATSVSTGECARRRTARGPVIKEISIEGVSRFSEKKIKGLMRTRQSRFLRTERYRESTLEADLVSIVAFYRRNGFLNAEAKVDEVVYDDNRENVWIHLRVTEGEQTLIGNITLTGNRHLEDNLLKTALTIKVGKPLNTLKVSDDQYNLYALYADRGFVFASIMHQIEGEDGEATVRYVIEEGEPAAIGTIEVRDNRKVSAPLIRREILLKPGDTFARKKVLESQQNLYDTGLFKDVEIEPFAGESDSGSVDLIVKVKERNMREVSFGLGYGTRDETRVTVGWSHRNLWNSGNQLELRTILASKDFDKGLTRKRGDIAVTDRWLFGRRLVGAVALFIQESLEEYKDVDEGEYTLLRVGADLSAKKDFSRSTDLTFTYTHEIVDVSEPTWDVEDTEDLRINLGQEVNRSASVAINRDTRRPFFDPQGGSLTRMIAKTAGGVFGGDNSYNKLTWSWARYLKVYHRSVLAVGTRIGFAEAFGKSSEKGVPDYERFFAGGSSTIRGYDEREFGPGDFLALANVELRYPLYWRFVGVAFLDMGNVWPTVRDVRRSDFDLVVSPDEFQKRRASDVKYSVGIGLGLRTPVGPARVDYGLRLKRGRLESGKKESPGMVHITVGHAF
jgi:outer membrane protein insertion porin family